MVHSFLCVQRKQTGEFMCYMSLNLFFVYMYIVEKNIMLTYFFLLLKGPVIFHKYKFYLSNNGFVFKNDTTLCDKVCQ
jgi:hypothetical protein